MTNTIITIHTMSDSCFFYSILKNYLHTYIHTYIRTYVRTYRFLSTCSVYTYTNASIRAYTNSYWAVDVYVCMNICMYGRIGSGICVSNNGSDDRRGSTHGVPERDGQEARPVDYPRQRKLRTGGCAMVLSNSDLPS